MNKETEKTINLTRSISDIADILMNKYSADINIQIMKKPTPWFIGTRYVVNVNPWNSELSFSICVSDFDIRNTDVSDLISLRLDDAVAFYKKEIKDEHRRI